MNLTQILILITLIIIFNLTWNRLHTDPQSIKTIQQLNKTQKTIKAFSTAEKLFLTFITLIPLLGGLWSINYWFSEYNIAKESINWDIYPGKILSKKVSYFKPTNSTGSEVSGKLYTPEVKYEFTYNNKLLQWDVIDFKNDTASGNIEKSEAILSILPEVGEPVDVYFSAQDKQAVLIPGHKNSNYFGVIVGIIFLSIGLISIKYIYAL